MPGAAPGGDTAQSPPDRRPVTEPPGGRASPAAPTTATDPADRGRSPAAPTAPTDPADRRGTEPPPTSDLATSPATGRRRAGLFRRVAGRDPSPGPGATGVVPREPGRGHRRAGPVLGTRSPAGQPRRRPAEPPTTGTATRADATPLEEADLDGSGDPPERPTRRRAILAALGVIAAASAAALVAGLPQWSPEPADPPRRLTRGEVERLAAMRVTNQRDVRAGVRVSVGTAAARTELVGWVDWGRPLVYLHVGGPGAGTERGLVQATDGTVVLRPATTAAPSPAPPPLVPPGDHWRLREPPPTDGVAAVRDLLLGLRADRTDLVSVQARWRGRGTADGTPVDILETPFPADPPSAPAGQVRLWLDGDARLHRLEGRLPDGRPVTVELARSDRPTLHPVAALGGRAGLPRALTDGETDRLARLPARLRALRGATVTVTAPLGPTANLRGTGWLSWTESAAYLAVGEADNPGRRTLLRWRGGRVARAQVPADPAAEAPAAPPLPPPAGLTWSAARAPGDDLDRLLGAALRAGVAAAPARSAVRVRGDRTADRSVDVIEVRASGTTLRYWIDRDGLLRRLELLTGRRVWAQLDLTPGRVPTLPGAPAAPKPRRR
ncbi:hypothetical protein ACL02O_20745 [Micromonospora sp. MS34]|uniref:hypothetical protein n=1 Tax=Micromonospora sp. MS34 TaxID=3385971 RepID=UPI0039A24940